MGGIVNSDRIFKLVRQKAASATLETLSRTADRVLAELQNLWKAHNITGNSFTGITVGVFYKGRLMYMAANGERQKEPTRPSLRKGERYNLPDTYDNEPNKGFKGTYGNGGQWGPTLGPWTMRRQHPAKRNTWELIILCPTSYAEFVVNIVRSMTAIRDELPQMVDCSIVRVENTNSQTSFMDVPF